MGLELPLGLFHWRRTLRSDVEARIQWVRKLHDFLGETTEQRNVELPPLPEPTTYEIFDLPSAHWEDINANFREVLKSRKSRYACRQDWKDWADLSTLLSASETAPSAGGLHSVSLFLLAPTALTALHGHHSQTLEAGSYRVLNPTQLQKCVNLNPPQTYTPWIQACLLQEEFVARFPLILVFVGNMQTMFHKYGIKNYQMLFADTGVMLQNLLLTCEALGLAACPVGGINGAVLNKLLHLDMEEIALMAMPLGYQNE